LSVKNLNQEQKIKLAKTTTDGDNIRALINDNDPEVRKALTENISIYNSGGSNLDDIGGGHFESSGNRPSEEGLFESGDWILYLPAVAIALIISFLTGDFDGFGF